MTPEPPMRGNLKDTSLPQILVAINRKRATGTFSISSMGVTKNVYLSKGEAIFASSTYADDRLGEMLIKAGKITVEQYDKSVELLKRTGKRQGTILVELGYLTPKDLFWGVKFQVREIINSLFNLEAGDYTFMEGEVPSEVITLKMSMGNLIYEAIRGMSNLTRIRRDMPEMDTRMALSHDPMSLFQDVELKSQDKKILSLVDGKRTLKKIIEDSWLNSFEAMKTLYLLWSIGIIIAGEATEEATITVEEILKPLPVEEDVFVDKVNTLYDRLSGMTHFELLGVRETAGTDDIRKNYYSLAKEYHPDRYFDSTDIEFKDRLSAIFDAVSEAYNMLKDEDGRKNYLASIGVLGKGSESNLEEAEESFKAGLALLKKGDNNGAVEKLTEAARGNPERADYWSNLALAFTKAGNIKKAEEAMVEAINCEPSNSDYYANLGLLYAKSKKTEEAKTQFEKALALDPDNKKARKAMEKM